MEIWKDIKGYEGIYMASSYGNVMSLPRGKGSRTVPHILAPRYDGNGYVKVGLSKNNHTIDKKVHRLVAEAFLGESPRERPTVNHKDGNHANNKIENLEWASQLENNLHSIHVLKNRYVPIAKYSLDGRLLQEYESVTAAANDVGAWKTNIVKACNAFPKKSCAGFRWKYINGHHRRKEKC